jgi:DNA-nicking Smr family endonuclease
MEVWQILIFVGSIAICGLFAAILTCCLYKKCKRKIRVGRNVSSYQSPLTDNDSDVEAQRETDNGDSLRSSASRNVYTSNHSQPRYLQQSRPNSVATISGTMPFAQPSYIQRSRPKPLATISGTMPFAQPSYIQRSRPKPLATISGTHFLAQPNNMQHSRPRPLPLISGTDPFEDAVQSNHPNVNHYYQDETPKNYISSSGNQTTRSSSNQHQQNLPRQSGTTSSDTSHPVSVMKPSQQEIDINSSVKVTKYAELDLHFFRLNEAMTIFKLFLSESIEEYEKSHRSKQKRFIEVITGRGKHSPNGIPVIKPAVESYLIKHQYKFTWSNPGKARIDLLSVL